MGTKEHSGGREPLANAGRSLAEMPTTGSWFRTIREAWKDPYLTFLSWAKRYGDTVYVRMPAGPAVFISAPADVKRVMQDNAKNYKKAGPGTDAVAVIMGDGMFPHPGGPYWLRQRRIAQPAFHRERIAALGEIMVRLANEMVDSWHPLIVAGKPVPIAKELSALTLRIVGESLFGEDFSADSQEIGDAIAIAVPELLRLAQLPISVSWPLPSNIRIRRARDSLKGVILARVNSRKQTGKRGPDLLSMFMETRDEETGETMAVPELVDEAVTLLIAGHETTASTLTFAIQYLALHEEPRNKVLSELDQVLGDRAPGAADFPKLVYTKAVIEETLRLVPPVWITERRSIGPDVLGGYSIPADTEVFVSPYATHRDPKRWERPDDFMPERFVERPGSDRSVGEYLPFGGGPRKCIGMGFAMTEAVLTLAVMLRRCSFELLAGFEPPLCGLVLRPASDVPMRVREVPVRDK